MVQESRAGHILYMALIVICSALASLVVLIGLFPKTLVGPIVKAAGASSVCHIASIAA